ncbi:MAG: hypothetical protein JWM88_592 [Verrucomicrobia bacterium]|nr:hypothetical protein [Verrucomicrobiota bacterium]
MESLLVLLLVYLVAALVVFPVWVLVKSRNQDRELNDLRAQVGALENEIQASKREAPTPAPAQAMRPAHAPSVTTPAWIPASVAPVPPPPPVAAPIPAAIASAPPMLPPPPPAPPPPRYTPPASPAINWEQFMGAKLFAWLGGLALFLGVAFFVRYSFEHNLIPPQVRVAIGFVVGIGLIAGGLKLPRKKYAITVQTLVGAGIVSLYAVTFACNSIYHFDFFGPLATFVLMTLITAAAFILAVRLDAPAVAILGILGGFLTPILLSTGVDNPLGLFGYLALLVTGLSAAALHRRWFYLVPIGAAGTVLMLIAWAEKFYVPEKTPTAMAVCTGFSFLYLAVYLVARRLDRAAAAVLGAAVALPLVSLGFVLFFVETPAVGGRPGLLFPFLLVSDFLLLALIWLDERITKLQPVPGLAAFGLLALWTTENLTDALLPWALAAFLLLAAVHAVFPLLLGRRRPGTNTAGWGQFFPPLALLLILVPLVKLETASMLFWPAILLVDVLAIGLAVVSASLTAVAAVLVLTLLATGVCLFKVPAGFALEPSLLLIVAGFSVFFFVAGIWLTRRLGDRLSQAGSRAVFGSPRTQLPAFSSLLPFALLIMVTARLAVPDPSAIFGLALLLVILVLGLTRVAANSGGAEKNSAEIEWLPACALAGVAALEFAWHGRHFDPSAAARPLAWYLGFYAVFAAYPFVFRRTFARSTGPWAVAALGGLAQFWILYRTIRLGWPDSALDRVPGAIPALFALAPLASLFAVLRSISPSEPKRLNQLAWFGGVALCFITLVFPIQFDRQWLTVGWALEGAALLWLFQRVPHSGLRATGTVLLAAAFVRLALNPAVLGYHVRGGTPVLNWYLYAYALTIAALCFGARRLNQPVPEPDAAEGEPPGLVSGYVLLGFNVAPLLNTLGIVLAFLLLNLEIADYFTAPGSRALGFQFSGNFARDMSYTIAWALFALALLALGIWKEARAARYAAIILLSVALVKLFFHDLALLEALYRIGALLAVAVIAILASVAYQRFLPSNEKIPPSEP